MMDRKLLITLHLYLAAFLAPAVLLVAISGGLYLAGVKGNVEETSIYRGSAVTLDPEASTLEADVARALAEAGVQEYSFEYVKVSGHTLTTRPTSKHHYILKLHADAVEVIAARPSLQSRLIELHKGHGPTLFKTYQKAFAIGLALILLSGLWLGITAKRLRRPTLVTAGIGTLLFALLIF